MKPIQKPASIGGAGAASAAMQQPRRMLCAGAVLALLALAACSSGPPPRLMLLSNDVAAPPAAANVQRPLLVVRTVSVPEYLDRRAIVYRSGEAELKRFPDAVWAERLGQSVTRWVALQLAADLPDYEVQAFAAVSGGKPGLALNLELQSFEPEASPGGAAVLHLRGAWQLSGAFALDGQLIADVPMTALDAPSTVAAMRAALTQASEAIAQQLLHLRQVSGAPAP